MLEILSYKIAFLSILPFFGLLAGIFLINIASEEIDEIYFFVRALWIVLFYISAWIFIRVNNIGLLNSIVMFTAISLFALLHFLFHNSFLTIFSYALFHSILLSVNIGNKDIASLALLLGIIFVHNIVFATFASGVYFCHNLRQGARTKIYNLYNSYKKSSYFSANALFLLKYQLFFMSCFFLLNICL